MNSRIIQQNPIFHADKFVNKKNTVTTEHLQFHIGYAEHMQSLSVQLAHTQTAKLDNSANTGQLTACS